MSPYQEIIEVRVLKNSVSFISSYLKTNRTPFISDSEE